MSSKLIKVGVIGGSYNNGWAKSTHIPVIQKLPQFELSAVSTTNKNSAEKSAQKFKAKHGFDSATALASCDDIDLIVISVKVSNHFEVFEEVIQAKKAIYCEWPLAVNTQQAIEMERQVYESQIFGIIGLQSRFSPTLRYVKDIILNNELGNILSVRIQVDTKQMGGEGLEKNAYLYHQTSGGNLLTIVAGHVLDAFTFIFGDIDSLSSLLGNKFPVIKYTDTNREEIKSAYDQILIQGSTEKEVPFNIHIQGGVIGTEGFVLKVFGSEGTLELSSTGRIQHGPYELKVKFLKDLNWRNLNIPRDYFCVSEKMFQGVQHNIATFYLDISDTWEESIATVPSFADAVKLHQLLDKVFLSSTSGRMLKIEK